VEFPLVKRQAKHTVENPINSKLFYRFILLRKCRICLITKIIIVSRVPRYQEQMESWAIFSFLSNKHIWLDRDIRKWSPRLARSRFARGAHVLYVEYEFRVEIESKSVAWYKRFLIRSSHIDYGNYYVAMTTQTSSREYAQHPAAWILSLTDSLTDLVRFLLEGWDLSPGIIRAEYFARH